ncbi:unnamed protein product, partial [Mesorhabditis spiculigera]
MPSVAGGGRYGCRSAVRGFDPYGDHGRFIHGSWGKWNQCLNGILENSVTEALSGWTVQDAVIVLFTGSDASKFAAAGRDYTKNKTHQEHAQSTTQRPSTASV